MLLLFSSPFRNTPPREDESGQSLHQKPPSSPDAVVALGSPLPSWRCRIALTCPPHSPPFALSQIGSPGGVPSFAEGLRCARPWGGWNRLEPAVPGAGQHQPALTEPALQPAPGHGHPEHRRALQPRVSRSLQTGFPSACPRRVPSSGGSKRRSCSHPRSVPAWGRRGQEKRENRVKKSFGQEGGKPERLQLGLGSSGFPCFKDNTRPLWVRAHHRHHIK